MKEHSTKWKRSKQPRKQRKYRLNAPLHLKSKFLSVHLSPELRASHKKRSIVLRKNDSVKIMRGGFKGKIGKVTSVDIKRSKAYIEGIENTRKDGTKSFVPIEISNLMITEMGAKEGKRTIKNDKESS